ncbi:hypothetical protein D1BOALGB6SA_3560 [Olavius sp. associated proteobacterium Delta 1]|nr:hypothetical protein D1BOALGB6SA_3560 [Olavius sp. associated proteobacterium Delta 1]
MGANLDKNEKSFFIIDKHEWKNGAIAAGAPDYAENLMVIPNRDAARKSSSQYTWLVCPHLSQPDFVYRYYLASGLITMVLGKCFCEDCLDRILSNDDLSELIGSCRPMTDKIFQANFISPLIDSNFNFTKMFEQEEDYENPPKTWITCSHTATWSSLKKAYETGGQLFIFEGFFTCQDCFEKIPTDSLVDLLYEGESMTDAFFQNRIIDSLYTINYDSLDAVGHFEHTRHK